jgi:predicted DNA-binding transcriptional regulator YafY
LLSQGDNLEVLEPEKVREEMNQTIKNMIGHYKN